MDESGNTRSHLPVVIEPKYVYGIRSEVIGNIHFNHNQEVIYPVEGVIAFHDFVKNKQRFLKLPAHTAPTIMTLNATRLLMALVERTLETEEVTVDIAVYDLLTFKRQRTFQLPSSATNKQITQLSFTCDSQALVVLTEYPDEMLYMFFFDRLSTICEGRAGNTNLRGMANYISCHPHNPNIVAVCGEGLFKLLTKSEKGLSLINDIKPDINGTCIAWISTEMLFIGTSQGLLILFEKCAKKSTFQANEVTVIDLLAEREHEEQSFQDATPTVEATNQTNQRIVCMIAFPKGLAYAIFNQVYVFERITKTRYERKTILEIPAINYPENLYQISNMAINSKQDTIIVTPTHNQIYAGILIVPESLKTQRLQFSPLGELIHIDEVQDICVCSWRPIVISSSKDKTIRIWNYQTEKVELVKRFPTEVTVIELFASGQYAAVGFTDKLRIMQIFMNDLNIIKLYNFPNSKDVKFSYLGHLMATAYEGSVAITSVFSLENLKTFKGHTGIVYTVAWSRNDKYVISGGDDGAIYQWDVETGDRLQELIHAGTKYLGLCVPKDPTCFFAATDSGILREIKDSKVVNEIKIPNRSALLDIALTRSDLIMFAATKAGNLYNVHMPLTHGDAVSFTEYPFFDSAITKLRFSYDGSFLISCSAGGTLVIWQLKNIDGKLTPIDQDLLKSHEVLIPRKDLEDKIATIKSLEDRLRQQAAEFYQKKSQNEENDQQQMAAVHKGYCEALNELKTKNEEIGVKHAEELTQVTSQIDELNAEHKTLMDNLAAQYSERMQIEYQKFANLRENMLNIRETYHNKLEQSEACLKDTVEALESDYKQQLEERQDLIRQLMKEMDDKKLEFSEYCRLVEVENDRNMIDCQIEYEKKVKFERDETDKWKNQADTYKLKYDSIKKESENLLTDVEKLRQEHFKSKSIIAELEGDIRDLHKDLDDREEAINIKENRIGEILQKNKDLDKYKVVLMHKINELREQIEPREMQIIEKRKQVTEMEHELNGLQKNNLNLELQLKELKDKFLSVNVELKQERSRVKSAELCITDMRSQIHQVASEIGHPDKLKVAIRNLFLKYYNDDALKKYVSLDTQIQAELNKQRAHIEKIMFKCQQKMHDRAYQGKSRKLKTENKILTDESKNCRQQNENLQKEIANMEILGKIFEKTKEAVEEKSGDTLVSIERIDEFFQDQVADLKSKVREQIEENGRVSEELNRKRKMIHKADF